MRAFVGGLPGGAPLATAQHQHALPPSDREKEGLETIRLLLASIEQAHEMIGQLSRTVIALNDRLVRLEAKRPRLIVPGPMGAQ